MPTISGTTTVQGGQTVQNILSDSQYEYAPFDGTIELGMFSNRDDTTCAVFSGPDVLQEPGGLVPNLVDGTVGIPKYPDDYHWEDEVAQGDRLKVSLTNGDTVNTAIVRWVLRITPA